STWAPSTSGEDKALKRETSPVSHLLLAQDFRLNFNPSASISSTVLISRTRLLRPRNTSTGQRCDPVQSTWEPSRNLTRQVGSTTSGRRSVTVVTEPHSP